MLLDFGSLQGRFRSARYCSHCSFDSTCGLIEVLMFPDPQDSPSRFFKDVIRLRVSLHVSSQLRLPPFLVRCGHRAVFGAAVPEAAIYEHRNTLAGEHDVRLSAEPGQGCTIHPKPKASSVESTPQRHFRRRVSSGLSAHPDAHCVT